MPNKRQYDSSQSNPQQLSVLSGLTLQLETLLKWQVDFQQIMFSFQVLSRILNNIMFCFRVFVTHSELKRLLFLRVPDCLKPETYEIGHACIAQSWQQTAFFRVLGVPIQNKSFERETRHTSKLSKGHTSFCPACSNRIAAYSLPATSRPLCTCFFQPSNMTICKVRKINGSLSSTNCVCGPILTNRIKRHAAHIG